VENGNLETRFDVILLDTEGTPEHFARGTSGFVDTVLVVAEPHFASLEAARRMSGMGRALGIPRVLLVANKVRDQDELGKVRAFASDYALELAGAVPWDDAIAGAERAARAPLDFQADTPAIRAMSELAAALAPERLSPSV
jgi:CO dehydrogenase maturation factor